MKPKNINESWYKHLEHLFHSPKMEYVVNILRDIHPNYSPAKKDIFKAFEYFDFSDTRVVIVSIAPNQYLHSKYKDRYATGLAMGVKNKEYDTLESKILRDSLALDCHNIVVEESFDWSLEHWAKQGILLLNIALTVELNGKPKSHISFWEFFTSEVLKILSENLTGLIFVGLGETPTRFIQRHINSKNHYLLSTCAPLQTWHETAKVGFDTTKLKDEFNFTKYSLFSDINEILENINNEHINWLL